MAKITQLPTNDAITGAESVPIVQDGVMRQLAVLDLLSAPGAADTIMVGDRSVNEAIAAMPAEIGGLVADNLSKEWASPALGADATEEGQVFRAVAPQGATSQADDDRDVSGEVRLYLRTETPPFYRDLGDAAAQLSRGMLRAETGARNVGISKGGAPHVRTVEDFAGDHMSARDWGAVGRGKVNAVGEFFDHIDDALPFFPHATSLASTLIYNPLKERFSSFAQAKLAYPWLADLFESDDGASGTIVDPAWQYEERDWAALQHSNYECFKLDADTGIWQGKKYVVPDGEFAISRYLVMQPGVTMQGYGRFQTKARRVTRLLQTTNCGDMMRFAAHVDVANGQGFWNGTLKEFGIYGDNSSGRLARPDCTAIAFYTPGEGAAKIPVALQNNTHLAGITVRGIKGNGFDFSRGALPASLERLEAICCTKSGLIWRKRADGTKIDCFSADGCGEEAILIDELGADSSLVLVTPKFEKHYNYDFPTAGKQHVPIRIRNEAEGASITVIAPSSISAQPDPYDPTNPSAPSEAFEKPGSLIVHEKLDINGVPTTVGATSPSLIVIQPAIRVRATDTGPEPYLFESASLGKHIPRGLAYFSMSNRSEVRCTQYADAHEAFGLLDRVLAQGLGYPTRQTSGPTPGHILIETDGPGTARAWGRFANGGTQDWRVLNEATGIWTRYEQNLLNSSGKPYTALYRLSPSLGTTHAAADFALGFGWGPDASVAIVNAGKDNRFEIEITAGSTGLMINPGLTFTFKDGAWPSTPFAIATGYNLTDNTGVFVKATASTTQLFMNMLGTPVAGKHYRIQCHVL
jgi:hypothetical protein